MIRRHVIGSVAALAVTACTLTACGSDGKDGDGTNTPKPTGSTSKSSASAIAQPTKLPSPSNSVALRKSVTMDSCKESSGGWQAGGTAKNTKDAAFTYLITVYFTTPSATVVGYKRIKVRAKLIGQAS